MTRHSQESGDKKFNEVRTTSRLFNKELSDEEIGYWKHLLEPYPEAAVEFAFDNWRRNGQYFPRPASIVQLISTWHQSQKKTQFVACERNGCSDGWKLVHSGRTEGGNLVEEKYGAAVRCQCWHDYMAGLHVPGPERPQSGYGASDVKIFQKLFLAERAKLGRPLTKGEVDGLLDTLDSMTNRSHA